METKNPENQGKKINERFKEVRRRFTLNQKQFADRLGYKQGHISELENGVKNISSAIILALEDVFGVNRKWLETGEGPMLLEENSYPHIAQEHQDHYGGQNPDIKDKLILSYERNLEAQEKNIRLLEEISRLKDHLIEKEREISKILLDEKNSDDANTRVSSI